MSILEQTQDSMSDLVSNRQREFGGHASVVPRFSLRGTHLGEVPFIPGKHQFKDINPFSLAEEATGIPHVLMVLPKRALNIQIIEDKTGSDDDPRIVDVKQRLAGILHESIVDSKPGMTDRVRHYAIIDPTSEIASSLDYDTELIDSTTDREVVSKTVADICLNGLTFIISDFNRLNFDNLPKSAFEKTIAIKANHPAEIEIPQALVSLGLGRGREADLRKPKELTRLNASLKNYNQSVVNRLEKAGMAVAQVVFDSSSRDGFDMFYTDNAIAAAIKQISAR